MPRAGWPAEVVERLLAVYGTRCRELPRCPRARPSGAASSAPGAEQEVADHGRQAA